MSAGAFQPGIYLTNNGVPYPVSIQPETLSLVLNGQANDDGVGPIGQDIPSAIISGSYRQTGVICRRVRFRFNTATIPPGYQVNSVLTLPVLTITAFNEYRKGTVGTYTLNGIDYSVAFVGKSPERIN